MTHKKPNSHVDSVGTGRRQKKLAIMGTEIITQPPFLAKQNRRPAPPAQIRYLQALRLRTGLNEWNRIKNELGITTPGTHGLGVAEPPYSLKRY